MAEEREPFPTEDPREKTTSDQNTEENPADTAPDPADEDESDAGRATGNPGRSP
jgi:hypothetical protein